MEVTVKFAGGPLDGAEALTDGLDEAKIFFDERDKRVSLYIRIDELVYAYSHQQSVQLTDRYDDTKAFFAPKEAASLRFLEPDADDEE